MIEIDKLDGYGSDITWIDWVKAGIFLSVLLAQATVLWIVYAVEKLTGREL